MSMTVELLQKNFPELTGKICYFRGDELKNYFHNISLIRKFTVGRRIFFTNGCFDLFHSGHLALFYEIKREIRKNYFNDILIVGLNSDKSTASIKGPSRPVISELDRAVIIASLDFVSKVIIFDEETPEKLITQIQPDFVVKGRGYKEQEIVSGNYAPLILDTVNTGLSTTEIIDKI